MGNDYDRLAQYFQTYPGTTALTSDPAVLSAAASSFASELHDLDESLTTLNPDVVAENLTRSVAILARRFGWSRSIAVRFAPADLPRVRDLPATTQHFTCVVRVAGEIGFDIVVNSSFFRVGNLRLLTRIPVLVWLFGRALEREPRLVADFTCLLGDPGFWPVVSFSACHEAACLIPDSEFFASGGYSHFRDQTTETTPWKSRIRQVFWRGSTSGIKRYWPPTGPGDLHWLPRLDLCTRAQAPDLANICDVGITTLVQVPPDHIASAASRIATLMRPPVEKASFAQFKAVIDIDGNSNAWSGLFTSLLSGACVIKIESELGFRQWYYDRLEPWVHYVPVKADLSDFDEKVRFVLSNDDAAHAIAEAGCRFAREMDFAAEIFTAADRLIAWTRDGHVSDGGRPA